MSLVSFREFLITGTSNTFALNSKQHKVFETSFDWKHYDSDKMLEQKFSYIHNNPCKGKWNLATSSVKYVHSSAQYYLTGVQGFYL